MDRKFSKDISEYKKDIFRGLTLEEVIVIITALVLGVLVALISINYLGISVDNAIYPSSIIIIPVVYLFFKKENGLPLIKVIIKKRKLKKTSKMLGYKSTENQILKIEEEERRKSNEKKGTSKRKKLL